MPNNSEIVLPDMVNLLNIQSKFENQKKTLLRMNLEIFRMKKANCQMYDFRHPKGKKDESF